MLVLEERAEEAIKTKADVARELAAVRQQMKDREAELKMVDRCICRACVRCSDEAGRRGAEDLRALSES